jgi:hypothetical protein
MNDVAPNELTRLAEVARTEHLAVGKAAKNVVEHALRCGEALNAAKSKLDAGTWLTWLSGTEIKERTAQRYMKLAANRKKLEAAVAERSDTMSGVTFNHSAKSLRCRRPRWCSVRMRPTTRQRSSLGDVATEMAS